MGSAHSKVLKAAYNEGEFEEVISHSDASMGSYRIVKFHINDKELFLLKQLDPSQYDQYTSDVEEFGSKLCRNHPNICEFGFFEPNALDPNIYDLVFEFGDYINTHFQNEKVIWTFITHLLSGLIFLQEEGMHYPILRKRFTVYQSSASVFKLLNPYCFVKFVDNVLGIYLNTQVSTEEKQSFQSTNLQRNVKEFGIMVLSLIKNVEEASFFKNPSSIKPALMSLSIEHNYSQKLINFLSYAIENKSAMNFHDLRRMLNNENPSSYFDNIDSNLQLAQALKREGNLVQSTLIKPQNEPNLSQTLSNLDTSIQFNKAQKLETTSLKVVDSRSNIPNGYESERRMSAQPPSLAKPPLEAQSIQQPVPQKQILVQKLEETPFKPAIQTKKKIKRIVMKWSQEAGAHKEFYEFEDGTTEEVQVKSVEESQKMIEKYTAQTGNRDVSPNIPPPQPLKNQAANQNENLSKNQPDSHPKTQTGVTPSKTGTLSNQKPSVMGHYDVRPVEKPVVSGKTTWNIVLFNQISSEPAKLILTATVKEEFNRYNFMKDVVNRRHPLKPSSYHMIDDGSSKKEKEMSPEQMRVGFEIRAIETHPFTMQNKELN